MKIAHVKWKKIAIQEELFNFLHGGCLSSYILFPYFFKFVRNTDQAGKNLQSETRVHSCVCILFSVSDAEQDLPKYL